MPNLLITGGAGFIGANLVKMLLELGGYRIHVLDNFSVGCNRKYLGDDANLTVTNADITRENALLDSCFEGTDYVIHLAAHTSVLESMQRPAYSFEQNAAATFRLLQKATKTRVKHFIFASTGAVVGIQESAINEGMLPSPISHYAASKAAGEAFLCSHANLGDMCCTALRFSNAYGPFSEHKGSVVAKFIKRALHDEEVEIYGDGTQTRDFVYVDDVCAAVLSTLKARHKFEIFQVGSGAETSINALLECLESTMHKRIRRRYRDFNVGEVIYSRADITKARKRLCYEPHTSFQNGIAKTVAWFRQRS